MDHTIHLDECLCPDGKHGEKGDSVTFRSPLPFAAVRAIRYAGAIARDEDPESSIATLMAVMSEGFIMEGIESWTLRDKGKPLEVSKANIRLHILGNMVAAQIIGDHADLIYQPEVLHPLTALARRSLQPSPTKGSTSAPNGSPSTSQTETEDSPEPSSIPSVKRPKRSRPSSTTSTQTGSIAATSAASGGAFTS
jgi:hypothetical protein